LLYVEGKGLYVEGKDIMQQILATHDMQYAISEKNPAKERGLRYKRS